MVPTRIARVLLTALCLLAVVLSSADRVRAADTDSPVGTWNQYDDKKGDLRSVIRIETTGGELVGTILKAVLRPGEPTNPKCEKCPGEFKDKPIEGLRFMWGLKGQAREWDGGQVLDPDDGKIYRVKVKLSDDGRSLEVRGYIGISMFGRTQRWVRAQ
jgi:uncharacterized protein (DUF2147 family)